MLRVLCLIMQPCDLCDVWGWCSSPIVVYTEMITPNLQGLTMSYPQVVVLSCSIETHQCYPEEAMVHVWFLGPHSDLSLSGAWPWVETLGQQRVSSSALPRASESALARYPGLANRSKWQRENHKALLFTKFKYDSNIYKNPNTAECRPKGARNKV
jgi:hypothetical protein